MAVVIDYSKYANMNEKQLLNSLLSEEKKQAKIKADLQEKLDISTELIKFLKAKLKESIDRPRYDFIPLEQTQSFKNYNERLATMSESQKAQLIAEVENEINRDYSDEL